MWRSCPLLIIISCLLWGRENSHLSLPANQPVSPEQVAKCVHSWDRLIKWRRFLTISPGRGTLSSLSPGSTLDSLKGTDFLFNVCLWWLNRRGSRGLSCFVGNIKTADSFCLRAESSNSLICSNGALHLCTSSPPCAGYATRNSECEQQIRPSNSRSLYCRNSDTHHQPWELLIQFTLLGHKNSSMLQWNCSLAIWKIQQHKTQRCKLQVTQQNRIGNTENDRLKKAEI